MIERKIRKPIIRRQTADRLKKNEAIGELLKMEKVPLHCLEWKETKFELEGGDCYPMVDVILKLAEMVSQNHIYNKPPERVIKRPGRPKKV